MTRGKDAAAVGNFFAGYMGKASGFTDIELFLGAGAAEIKKRWGRSSITNFDWSIPRRIDEFRKLRPPYGDENDDYFYNKAGMDYWRLYQR